MLSPPHHLRLVGWAGIHTNYQITQGPLRRPPSSNQSNSIRFRLWFPNWCWHSHCLTLYIERVNSFFVACFCGVDDREVLMTKVWGNKNLTAILLNFQIRVNQNRFLDSAKWARKRKQIMKIITFGPKIAERKIWIFFIILIYTYIPKNQFTHFVKMLLERWCYLKTVSSVKELYPWVGCDSSISDLVNHSFIIINFDYWSFSAQHRWEQIVQLNMINTIKIWHKSNLLSCQILSGTLTYFNGVFLNVRRMPMNREIFTRFITKFDNSLNLLVHIFWNFTKFITKLVTKFGASLERRICGQIWH